MPVRREVRTLQLRQPSYFDDRLWPTNAALLALGGVLAGAAISDGNFGDPRPWLNGVVRLLAIGLVTGVSLWAVNQAGNPRTARYKLCVALSLLVHTMLAVLMNFQHLQYLAKQSEPAVVAPFKQQVQTETPPEVVVDVQVAEQHQPEFDKPVQSGAPQVQADQLTQQRTAPPAPESTADDAIAQLRLQPQPVRLDRVEASVARRSEDAGLRSRRRAPEPVIVDTTAQAPIASAPVVSHGMREQEPTSMPLARSSAEMPTVETTQPLALPVERREPLPAESPPTQVASRSRTPSLATTSAAAVAIEPTVPTSQLTASQQPTPQSSNTASNTASNTELARSRAMAANEAAPAEFASIAMSAAELPRRQVESLAGSPAGTGPAQPRPSRGPSRESLATIMAGASSPSIAEPTEPIAGSRSSQPSRQPAASTDSLARTSNQVSSPSTSQGELQGGAPILAARHQTGGGRESASEPTQSRGRRQSQPARLAMKGPIGTAIDTATDSGGVALAVDIATPGDGADSTPRATAGETTLARAAGQSPVVVDAFDGPGGLGIVAAPMVGLPDRRARLEAGLVHSKPARLIRKRAGSVPTISGTARVPAAAFAQRGRRQDELLQGGKGAPSAKTEAAIELGLVYLSQSQLADGRWSFSEAERVANPDLNQPTLLRADAAATGLALLSFLGAGYDHYDDKYAGHVDRGLRFLVTNQKSSGELFPEGADKQSGSSVTRFYSHGIATLALCEALGMTGDPELREPAQRALDYIMRTQHSEHGGWRYVPGLNSDLSVTGWQVMALRSGELAGLSVKPETYQRVGQLVEACRERDGTQSRFRYNPWASASNPRTRHGRQASTVMTAVGLLTQLYLGSNRDDPLMQRGADHLLANLPEMGKSPRPARTGTLKNPLRDTYYWYYATQVMFHMGGEHWETWNERLHPLLVETQTPAGRLAGSWHPRHPVPDKWAPYVGRLYVTTMNLLSLEVYYRHLPLYEMTAQ